MPHCTAVAPHAVHAPACGCNPHAAQRGLPLRLRQEVQALPRPGLIPAAGGAGPAMGQGFIHDFV